MLGAESEGLIGYLIEQELKSALPGREVATLLTQIEVDPSDAGAIKTTLLGTCIDRYVDDANVKECARRAAWLGNDETHYTRRWEDKDIADLKTLVRLTTNWVENALLTQQYLQQMPPPQR